MGKTKKSLKRNQPESDDEDKQHEEEVEELKAPAKR